MKKFIILTGVLVTLCLSSLNAQTNAQTASFNRKFSDASNVRWEKISSEISLARFVQSNANSLAYFDQSGDLVASGKQIELSQSPESVQKGLAAFAKSVEKKEGALRLIHAFQLTQENVTKYYVNMGNENVYMALLITSGGRTTVIRRSKPGSKGIEGPVIAAF